MSRIARIVIVAGALFGGASLGQSMSGCGGSAETPSGGSGGRDGGTDASSGVGGGGRGGSGGGSTTSTGTGSGCEMVAGMDPIAAGFPSCCDQGAAHCVPTDQVPTSLAPNFSACTSTGNAAGLCLPDAIIKAGSDYAPASCPSLGGAAGVCLSKCIKAVATDPNAGLLSKATCADDELCVPCINPITKVSTGACDIKACDGGTDGGMDGGDTDSGPVCPYTGPPIIDPKTLSECTPACGGAHCVPAALVPMSQQAQLAMCTTGGAPGFCAPDEFIATGGNFIPVTCTAGAGAEGRCVSECLPQVAVQKDLLFQSTCPAGDKCVPCFDPTNQAPTGACTLSCDPGPQKPPVVITCPYNGPPVIDPSGLPACAPACAGSHCVPSALIPAAEQSQLASCPGGFCAPDSLTTTGGQGVPATCVSVAGAEGRCVSTCLPAIAAQAALLPQSTCTNGEKCAPCFNPTAADPTAPTGACSLACDKPAQPPTILTCPWNGPPVLDPAALPACAPACGGAHCVPGAAVPAGQQAQLAMCPGGFCLPDPMIQTAGNFVPKTCSPFAGTPAEGRCLSDCLPSVAAQAGQLSNDVCASGEHCVPCYDPFSGQPTGACSSSSCDMPKTPAYTFPTCCPFNGMNQGTCAPKGSIPQGQQSNLQQLSCPANFLCVPDEYLPNPPIPVSTCSTFLGNGSCVSKCTTAPQLFTQGSCPGNHMCVPCSLAGAGTPGCP